MSISVTAQACVCAAFALMLVPLPWLIAWLSAALFHECCHIAAVILSKKQVHAIVIGVSGAGIQTESMTDFESMLCTLAGPIGGLVALPFTSLFPKLAVCALVQSVYNLLPVYPLDGGRALLCFLRLISQEFIACKICGAIRVFVLLAFIVFGVLAAVLNMGFLPLLMSLTFTMRMMKIKIPCK